jgi:two-component system, cell cycle response regulator
MARRNRPAAPSGHKVLVIDDSPEILASCRRLLEAEGHEVITAGDGESGLAASGRERPHVMVVDYFMPSVTGEEVVRRVRETDRVVQIILSTGYSGEKPARAMMRQLEIQGYHDKGDGPERLLLWVDSALKSYRQQLAMEKHRIGLQYILDITPDLHRLQPLDELLQGVLWQLEGLLGAESSFLATFSSEQIARVAGGAGPGGSGALVDRRHGRTDSRRDGLAIRVGTGRYRSGVPVSSLPEPERRAVDRVLARSQVGFERGVSVVPLRFGNQAVGVIYLEGQPGQDRDRDLLENFASQAAAAIQSALLYGRNALLYDLATKDPITGVYLRGYALQQLRQHLKRSHRGNQPISVLMIDLDRFERVNDRHGHIVGDDLLRAVGELLRDTVRETDCVARYGGDEFLIVLPDTPAEGARMVAQRILGRAKKLRIAAETGVAETEPSIGCGTLLPPPDGPDFNLLRAELVERAATELIACAHASLHAGRPAGGPGEPTVIDWGTATRLGAAA